MSDSLLLRYMQPLLAGRRAECFELIGTAISAGAPAETLLCEVVWPAMSQIDRLFREDVINHAAQNMAARINRTVADQLQRHLPRRAANGKRIVITCADDVNEETGAQTIADLFQSDGWDVYFLGVGVPQDEILEIIGKLRPDILLLFGTRPEAVPDTRHLVEWIREVNTCPTMNIIVSGGVFNRADGLWQEVGADVFAPTATDLLKLANRLGPRVPTARRVGVVKKRNRRRKPADTAASASSSRELVGATS